MSNWNGKGVPENGQRLAHELGGAINKFIGVNSAGDWVAEDGCNFPRVYSPYLLKPIKTPEQVEEEKAIDELAKLIMKIPHLVFSPDVTIDVAKALYEAGYHNQPKVKELNVNEWLRYANFPNGGDVARINIEALITAGHIIEAKEKDGKSRDKLNNTTRG